MPELDMQIQSIPVWKTYDDSYYAHMGENIDNVRWTRATLHFKHESALRYHVQDVETAQYRKLHIIVSRDHKLMSNVDDLLRSERAFPIHANNQCPFPSLTNEPAEEVYYLLYNQTTDKDSNSCTNSTAMLIFREMFSGDEVQLVETLDDRMENGVDAIKEGQFVVVQDDEDRENEGDLIIAAHKVTPAQMAFMIHHTSGLICVPMTDERADELNLPLMVQNNEESHKTAFTVSVDKKTGVSTGISAFDRAQTARALSSAESFASDFNRPGHMFPLRAKAGGTFERRGHTEASIDLMRLAGYEIPVALISEIVPPVDGNATPFYDAKNVITDMMRGSELKKFAAHWAMPIISIQDIVTYRQNLYIN